MGSMATINQESIVSSGGSEAMYFPSLTNGQRVECAWSA
jgi:hypothetical protein